MSFPVAFVDSPLRFVANAHVEQLSLNLVLHFHENPPASDFLAAFQELKKINSDLLVLLQDQLNYPEQKPEVRSRTRRCRSSFS